MQTIFKHKTIIISILAIIVAFIAYSFYLSGKKDTSTTVTKQALTTSSVQSSMDGPGKEFVTQLLAIQNIQFKLELFKDPVYIGLQDFSREIQPQAVGRPNPFAPLGSDSRAGLPSNLSDANTNVSMSGAANTGAVANAGATAGTKVATSTTAAKAKATIKK